MPTISPSARATNVASGQLSHSDSHCSGVISTLRGVGMSSKACSASS
jgi:hypothetical protein